MDFYFLKFYKKIFMQWYPIYSSIANLNRFSSASKIWPDSSSDYKPCNLLIQIIVKYLIVIILEHNYSN